MPSRQSVPRIRIDSPDSSPCGLSPSSTLDIKDILSQAELFPRLLAEEPLFDDADALYWEDRDFQNVPPLPVGHRPPLFILDRYRTRLPFHIRPEAFEMGDFCWNEEIKGISLMTIPTIPRMKLIMKEQLYVQKWVDILAPDHPPKHIPWTYDKPATERRWIAEGSIFPAATVKASAEPRIADKTRISVVVSQMPHSEESCASSEASPLFQVSTGSHTSTSHILVESADVDPATLRGKSKTLHTRNVGISHALFPPASVLPDASLAARRGKSLSGLKLKGSVIEQLEYPDIPTAFLGSPGVWSPRFEAFPTPPFTDHDKMLLDLKTKCAALESAVSTYTQETSRPQTGIIRTSPSVNEWSFTRELDTFDDFLVSIDSQLPKEIVINTGSFLPRDAFSPAKRTGFTAHLGFLPRRHPPPALQSPFHHSSNPPGVPLPPRPALIHPLTPPHVRGILKKVKNVRFEDATIISQSHTSSAESQLPSSECSSSVPLTASERSPTPTQNISRASSGPGPVEETPAPKNIHEKWPTPESRLLPKRCKASEKAHCTQLNASGAAGMSKPVTTATLVERPCRITRVKENTHPTGASQSKQRGPSDTEADLRRGVEGTVKSRLSTPLRNIFRFR